MTSTDCLTQNSANDDALHTFHLVLSYLLPDIIKTLPGKGSDFFLCHFTEFLKLYCLGVMQEMQKFSCYVPVMFYLFKVNSRNMYEICSKLTIKIPERRQ